MSAPPLVLVRPRPLKSSPDLLCIECNNPPPPRVDYKTGKPRRRKACWGCAVCEDVVQEPSVLSDAYNSRAFGPVLSLFLLALSTPLLSLAAAGSVTGSQQSAPSLIDFPTVISAALLGAKVLATTLACLLPVLLFNAVTASSKFRSKVSSVGGFVAQQKLSCIDPTLYSYFLLR